MPSHPFGQRIRQKRLALAARDPAYSLARLAARLGLPAATLRRLERGAAPRLPEDRILALAEALGDHPDRLLALAGKIPSDVRDVLLSRPEAFAALVRGLADRPDAEVLAGRDAATLLTSFRETQRLARVGSFTRDLVTGEDFWSEEFFRIFGLPPDNPTPNYDQFLSLIHPDDRPAVVAVRHKLLAGEGPLRYAYRFRRSDGLWRHAKAVARAECDASGRTVRLHGTVQDVTTERQAMDNLRSMARFPEDSPNPVLRVTGEGLLAYANAASQPLLEALGLGLGQPLPPHLAEAVIQARTAGRRLEIDIPVGETILAVTISPLPGPDGANLYGRDATRERAAAQALTLAEARRRRLFEDTPVALFTATATGRLLSVNPAMARLFGQASPEAMVAASGDMAMVLPAPDRFQAIAGRLERESDLADFEEILARRDGTVFSGRLRLRLAAGSDGRTVVEGSVEASAPGTEGDRDQAAREERLTTQLRNVPLPTLTFRLRGRELVLHDANRAAEALFRGRLGVCLEAAAESLFEETPDVYLGLWNALESRLPGCRRLSFRPPGADAAGLCDMTFVFAPPDTVMLHIQHVPEPAA